MPVVAPVLLTEHVKHIGCQDSGVGLSPTRLVHLHDAVVVWGLRLPDLDIVGNLCCANYASYLVIRW